MSPCFSLLCLRMGVLSGPFAPIDWGPVSANAGNWLRRSTSQTIMLIYGIFCVLPFQRMLFMQISIRKMLHSTHSQALVCQRRCFQQVPRRWRSCDRQCRWPLSFVLGRASFARLTLRQTCSASCSSNSLAEEFKILKWSLCLKTPCP